MKLRLVKDLTAVLLELPISVVEGANLASLQPSGDTMEMEGVLATQSVVIHGSTEESLTLQIPHATVHSSLVAEA
jgi:hypothetical protein